MAVAAMPTNHELETLRIERPQEQPRRKRSRLVSIAILILLTIVLGAASYAIYARTIGRSPHCANDDGSGEDGPPVQRTVDRFRLYSHPPQIHHNRHKNPGTDCGRTHRGGAAHQSW